VVFKFLKLILLDFWFFQHGGDVNATDHTGQTALHWSAVRGAIQVAELLLQEGARVDATDMYGYQVHLSSLTKLLNIFYQIFLLLLFCSQWRNV